MARNSLIELIIKYQEKLISAFIHFFDLAIFKRKSNSQFSILTSNSDSLYSNTTYLVRIKFQVSGSNFKAALLVKKWLLVALNVILRTLTEHQKGKFSILTSNSASCWGILAPRDLLNQIALVRLKFDKFSFENQIPKS
jgi:hypothetical protein